MDGMHYEASNYRNAFIILFTVVCLCLGPALAQAANQLTGNSQAQSLPPENTKGAAQAAPSALQLEFRVPFDPTVFPGGSHSYLVYEIHLTNFMPAPLSLRRIEVLDDDAEGGPPIAIFEAEQLEAMLRPLGDQRPSDPKERLVIGGGQSAIAFMWVAFDRSSPIPAKLLHRSQRRSGGRGDRDTSHGIARARAAVRRDGLACRQRPQQ
jgi:hypothetical protein